MNRVSGVLVAVLTLACAPTADAPSGLRLATDVGLDAEVGRVATSTEGMVVSSSAEAAKVGATILSAGGNAADAAVAAAFALAVAEPTQSGLGGRTQALVYRPSGETFGIDATTQVPAGHDPATEVDAEDGYAVIAIPGTVAGLARLMEEAGTLSWPEVIAPALDLAERGFPLGEGEAERLERIADRLSRSPGAANAFLRPDGNAFAPGDTLKQPDLARVLRTLALEGPEVFYHGWIAEAMIADFSENGVAVVQSDLDDYRAESSEVVRGSFGPYDLVGTYLPASGATTIEALQIIDRLGLTGVPEQDRVPLIGQALLAAFQDRESARADPRPPGEDARWITSVELAELRANEIRAGYAPAALDGDLDAEAPHTTHLSVVDSDGMAVAMTQSLGPTGGSRVATEGLGFLYAATLGYLDRARPGDRPWSSQSPLVVLRDGRVEVVAGGAGARRIVSGLVQTLVRVGLDGASIEAAMAAPRFHPTTRWHFEQTEPEVTPPGADWARAQGIEVVIRPFDDYFGRLNVVVVDSTGWMTGVADPRWSWGAAVPAPDPR